MVNVMKIRYADATLKQLTKAQVKTKTHNFLNGDTVDKVVLSVKIEEKTNPYKSYDRYGRLTLVGKAKRLTDLKGYGLGEDTTLLEFCNRRLQEYAKSLKKILKKVHKNFDGSYSGGR